LRHGYWLSIFGGLLFASSFFFEAAYVLHLSGYSFLQEFKLASDVRMFLSLCIFLGLSAVTLAFVSAYFQWRGFTRLSGFSGACASVLALFNVMVPFVYGFEVYPIFAMGTVLGYALSLLVLSWLVLFWEQSGVAHC